MVSSGEFGQGEGVLSRAAQMVTDARTDFGTYSRTLGGQLANLKTNWTGEGGRGFGQFEQTWYEKQEIVLKSLDALAESLNLTEKDNLATDLDQGANVAKLVDKLGEV